MSYRQALTEGAESFKHRVVSAWEKFVGYLPPIVDFFIEYFGDYSVLDEYADALDLLAEAGVIPENRGVIRLITNDAGRVIFYVPNNSTPVGVGEARLISNLLIKRPVYQLYVQQVVEPEHLAENQANYDAIGNVFIDAEYDEEGNIIEGTEEYGAPAGYIKAGIDRPYATGWWRNFSLGRATTGAELTGGRIEALLDVSNNQNTEHKFLRRNPPPYVIGWYIALVPLDAINEQWLAMHDGERNCLIHSVRTALGDVSERQDNAIAEVEQTIIDEKRGATYDDIEKLSAKLRINIVVEDLNHTILYQATNRQKARKITLYRSDGHCSTGKPEFGKIQQIKTYAATPSLNEESRSIIEARIARDVVRVITDNNLKRAQIVGSEIVTEDGIIYRPIGTDLALHKAAADAKERDGLLTEDRYTETEDGIYQVLEVGGVQAFNFRRWVRQQGFRNLWAESREIWRSATVEAVSWMSDIVNTTHWDMKSAYLGCDHREVMATGVAQQMAKRFRFPRGGRQRYAKCHSIEQVKDLVGLIHFTKISIQGHPSIKHQLKSHFARKQGWVTIPIAVWLYENNILKSYEVDEVIWDCDPVDKIEFPTDRDQAVRFIGSCQYSKPSRTFFTRDRAEAQHYMSLYQGYSAEHDLENGKGYMVQYPLPLDESKKDYSHVRSYVISYLSIAMWSQAIILGDALKAVSVDAMWVDNSVKIETDEYCRWGSFRLKADKGVPPTGDIYPEDEWEFPRVEKATYEIPKDEIERRPLTFCWGQGGSGKTTQALKRFQNRRVMILTPNNPSAINEFRDEKKNPQKFECQTYHQFFHLDVANGGKWDPNHMGKGILKADVVIWDEFAMAGHDLLSMVLPWLRQFGVIVVLTGDPLGQLQDFEDSSSGEKIMELMRELNATFDMGDGIDWRAKDCQILQEAKLQAWCNDDKTQMEALAKVAKKLSFVQMLNTWAPGDLILEATNLIGQNIHQAVENTRLRKYPTQPLRLIFRPNGEIRSRFKKVRGKLPLVKTPDGRYIPAAVGSRIEVPPNVNYDKTLWKPDVVSTVHMIQGTTIEHPRKIFICTDSLGQSWAKNSAYVAMSRAQRAEQLYIFSTRGR